MQSIKDSHPDYAKDIRLNLDAVIARSSLTPPQARGAALAAAFAREVASHSSRHPRRQRRSTRRTRSAALTAAALMGMNNVWYPFVEMAGDAELKTMRPELRMNAYATHGGVDQPSSRLYALAASIVGKCEFCVQSHYKLLRENGFTHAAAARRRPHRGGRSTPRRRCSPSSTPRRRSPSAAYMHAARDERVARIPGLVRVTPEASAPGVAALDARLRSDRATGPRLLTARQQRGSR